MMLGTIGFPWVTTWNPLTTILRLMGMQLVCLLQFRLDQQLEQLFAQEVLLHMIAAAKAA